MNPWFWSSFDDAECWLPNPLRTWATWSGQNLFSKSSEIIWSLATLAKFQPLVGEKCLKLLVFYHYLHTYNPFGDGVGRHFQVEWSRSQGLGFPGRVSQFSDGYFTQFPISCHLQTVPVNVCQPCLDVMKKMFMLNISSLATPIDNNWVCYTKNGSLLSTRGHLLNYGGIMLQWLLRC